MDLFHSESIRAIMKFTIYVAPRRDKLLWVVDSKGQFSVKSILRVNLEPSSNLNPNPCWKSLWKSKLHE